MVAVARVLDRAHVPYVARPQHQRRQRQFAAREARTPLVGRRLQLGQLLAHARRAAQALPAQATERRLAKHQCPAEREPHRAA